MSAQRNYIRLQPRNEPYAEDDAEGDVANQLIEAEEVVDLVSDIRGAVAALDWLVEQTNVPRHYQMAIRSIQARARLIDRMVETQIGVMS